MSFDRRPTCEPFIICPCFGDIVDRCVPNGLWEASPTPIIGVSRRLPRECAPTPLLDQDIFTETAIENIHTWATDQNIVTVAT
jgi:hypothetical protein